MCGRFTLRLGNRELEQIFRAVSVEGMPDLGPRYDIRPTSPIAVVRVAYDPPGRALTTMRWGLIPHWAKDVKAGPTPFNARSDGLLDKAMFATPLRAGRRLAIPATGYFEWKKFDPKGKTKQKYLAFRNDEEPFAFPGLWNRTTIGGQTIESATLITTDPGPLPGMIHDRMPVMLWGDALDRWLDPGITDPRMLMPLLAAPPDEELVVVPVQNASSEDRACVEATGPELKAG